MMALNASVVNLARGTLGSLTGVLFNKYFVGASKEDFDNFEIKLFGNVDFFEV